MKTLITDFKILDEKVTVEIYAENRRLSAVACGIPVFPVTTKLTNRGWAYVLESAELARKMEELSGRKIKGEVVSFGHDSAEFAEDKAYKIYYDTLSDDHVLSIIQSHRDGTIGITGLNGLAEIAELGRVINDNKKAFKEIMADLAEDIIYDDMFTTYKIRKANVKKLERELKERTSNAVSAEEIVLAELIEKARVTGVKQQVRQFSVECNDDNESCDIDIVTVYVDGNGEITEKRAHTW